MAGIICGTGSYIPEYTMDNNDIARLVETSDEWIRERTGVVKRHIIRDETTVSMASEAGRRALENGGVSPEEVDLILVATISSNVVLPGTACLVQKELGLPLIPSGELVQRLRAQGLGSMCRDGFHIEIPHGRAALALLWLKVLSGVVSPFSPVGADAETMEKIRACVAEMPEA